MLEELESLTDDELRKEIGKRVRSAYPFADELRIRDSEWHGFLRSHPELPTVQMVLLTEVNGLGLTVQEVIDVVAESLKAP